MRRFLKRSGVGSVVGELDKQYHVGPIAERYITVHGKHTKVGSVNKFEDRVAFETIRGSAGFVVPDSILQFSDNVFSKRYPGPNLTFQSTKI